jgi:ubiquinone/menaquinone biosynthesis C-methylase UbiE
MTENKNLRRADQYDDPNYNYVNYWLGREYENAAEEIAIRRFLKNKHFKNAIDVGGGYGRLSSVLKEYSDHVTLAEPSAKQLEFAKDYLKDHQDIDLKLLQASNLKIPDESVDLLIMIRVMHHLSDPTPEFKELHRVLKVDGYLILEVANYSHFLNKVRALAKGKKLPVGPIDIRSRKNKNKETIDFVNHNPRTVIKQLAHNGFKVEKILSVSNLRNKGLKTYVPMNILLDFEKVFQPFLAKSFFGPSIFLLVKKAK